MATRDLTQQFLERRSAAMRKRPVSNVSQRIISGGGGGGGKFYFEIRCHITNDLLFHSA